jgi:hypothetical protein
MKQLILVLTLCLAQGLAAQTILDDAKALSTIFNDYDATTNQGRVTLMRGIAIDEESATILRQYSSNGLKGTIDANAFRDGLEPAFSGNPFMKIEITDQNHLDFNSILKTTASAKPQASGFSVSSFADGLARFLVKRTKQELSRVFFENFKKKVKEDPYLGNFCPFTKAQLAVIDSKVYQFNDYLEALREGFTADMTVLPSSTERFL